MSSTLRRTVLQSFKSLHRARLLIFEGDEYALEAGRMKINEEYKKNMNVKNADAISELVKHAIAVENEIRTSVIQAKEVQPGKYEAKITNDTLRIENVPFNECGVKKKN